jgi:hypothetical protein
MFRASAAETEATDFCSTTTFSLNTAKTGTEIPSPAAWVLKAATLVARSSASLSNRNLEIIQINSVPEPGSLALIGTGLFGIGVRIRRKLRV